MMSNFRYLISLPIPNIMAEEVLVGDPNPLGLGSEGENLSREVPVAEEYPP